MTIRGPGRPWRKVKKSEQRSVLIGLRITPEDAKRLDAVLEELGEEESLTASTYAYAALLKALERDERRLARRATPQGSR